MCGRFTLRSPPEEIAREFGLDRPLPGYHPRYNVAPGQRVWALRRGGGEGLQPCLLRWGLVPFWARDPAIGSRMINARGETVARKPAYRNAFRNQRCLVLADGFYEWQRRDGRKHPVYVRRSDGRPFALAGLWERWGRNDTPLESCTVITTISNRVMAPIHDRMPVLLEGADRERWLEGEGGPDGLSSLLRPCADGLLEAYEVSTRVNSPAHDEPGCIEPLGNGVPDEGAPDAPLTLPL